MPKQKSLNRSGEPGRCSKKCLKKYMKPDLVEFQGETYRERFDSCLSAHYVCCKHDLDEDPADRKDAFE